MVRPLRLILGTLLLVGAACSADTPTAPKRSPNTMAPDHGALMAEGDSTCRGGWVIPNGKGC